MASCPLHTPVLFLVLNRPVPTKKVFEMIRKARPWRLYIVADGTRREVARDLENCVHVRNLVSQVDWPVKWRLFPVKKILAVAGPSPLQSTGSMTEKAKASYLKMMVSPSRVFSLIVKYCLSISGMIRW